MTAAYFFSGFDPATGFPAEIEANLRQDITRPDLLLFIASSPGSHAKSDLYAQGTRRWFEQAGISFSGYQLLDDRFDMSKAGDAVTAASCIYLMGGDTLAQFAFLQRNGLIDAIAQAHGVVAGLSAGAINMGKVSLCSRDEDVPETVLYHGIGIADITVEPHFALEKAALIAELEDISRQHAIHAMCDHSAIIVRNGQTAYFGDIYPFRDGHMGGQIK